MLAVDFVNTEYLVRGRPHDAIADPDRLTTWLHRNVATDDGTIDDDDVAAFHALRAAVRGLLCAVIDGRPAEDGHLAVVNAAAAAAPRWPVLRRDYHGDYTVSERTDRDFPTGALAAIAGDAVRLVGAGARDRLGACGAPGCMLLLVRDHPRRQWCSAACGNRARVARHHRRHTSP